MSVKRKSYRTLVLVSCALLLLIAAALKVVASGHGNLGDIFYVLGGPKWLVFIAVVEVSLAIFLIARRTTAIAWWVALGLFSCFAAFSLFMTIVGQSSCQCFGVVPTSPWVALSIDLTVVFLLLAVHPPDSEIAISRRDFAYLVLASFLVVGGFVSSEFTDIGRSVVAKWNKTPLLSESRIVLLGSVHANTVVVAELSLKNVTDKPVRVYGFESNCQQKPDSVLPMTIDSGGDRRFRVLVRIGESKGIGFGRLVFLVEIDGSQHRIQIPYVYKSLA